MTSTEQRVFTTEKKPAGSIREGRSKLAAVGDVPAETTKKKGKKPPKLVLIIGVVVLLAVAAAVYMFVLKPAGGEPKEPPPPPEPVPGAVLMIDPVSVNLAGGHYLRLGIGLQLTADVHEDPDPARALDLAIAQFSGQTVKEVSDPKHREEMKHELLEKLEEAYHHEVIDVYLTDFVTQ